MKRHPTPALSSFIVDDGPPQFHGARRVGWRPGTELIHTVATTGARPLTFRADGLPDGLEIDPAAGIVRGTAPESEGSYTVEVTAENSHGSTSVDLELCIGGLLALTPPMGWNSWNMYGSEVDAELIMKIADGMVSSGMRDLGYSYVNIDDHWHAAARGPGGVPVADPSKFPDGIRAVADYVHDRGLKLGIYSDAGDKTCGGCFGGYGYEEIDANAYAEWGVDLLKYDYCHAPIGRRAAIGRYSAMSDALESSGRTVVFSACEWGFRQPWEWAHSLGASMWRTTPDIFESWSSVRIIAGRNVKLAEFAGPGHWNDPDMLLIGNRGEGVITSGLPVTDSLRIPLRGISDMQALTHMSLWAMMASPLLASNDPTAMDPLDRDLLMNPVILSINQDTLGVQGRMVSRKRGVWVLRKPLSNGRQAISFTNMGRAKRHRSLRLASIGLAGGRPVADAWTMSSMGTTDDIEVSLGAHETRVFIVDPAGAPG